MGNIWKWAVLSGFLFFTGCGGGGSTSAPATVKPPKYTGETCMSANALLLGGGGGIVADAADFDGTNDYMTRGAALTGIADGKSGILSFWVRFDGGDGVVQTILTGYTAQFSIHKQPDNTFALSGYSTGLGGYALTMYSASAYTASSTWRHILISWNVATAATSLYVNDVSNISAPATVDGNIDYSTFTTNWLVGATNGGTNKINGCLAEFYFAPNQYLDFSVEANRRKFISAAGKPVHLGVDGSLPTGTAPIMYHHLDDGEAVANFATNRGTGGNFTITGTLDTATTSPSD